MLDEASSISEDINTTLLAVVDLILPDGRVAVGRDPDAGVGVRVDAVLQELAESVLVDVDAACEAVVDVAAHHGRVGARLHLEAGDPVGVDVVGLEVALRMEVEGEGELERGRC